MKKQEKNKISRNYKINIKNGFYNFTNIYFYHTKIHV